MSMTANEKWLASGEICERSKKVPALWRDLVNAIRDAPRSSRSHMTVTLKTKGFVHIEQVRHRPAVVLAARQDGPLRVGSLAGPIVLMSVL
jgi:hypothetical protein